MKRYSIYIYLVSLLFLTGCKKNEQDISYRDVPRIFLSGIRAESITELDSTSYTFTTALGHVTEHKLTLRARVSGNTSDVDRQFDIEVDQALSTADPSEYTLPPAFTIKAGQVTAEIPVIVKKSDRLEHQSVILVLKLKSNTNFEVSENNTYRFVWTNELRKPRTWDGGGISWYLGAYSKAKHRILLSVTTLDLETLDAFSDFKLLGEILYLQVEGQKALDAFNADPANIDPDDPDYLPLKNEQTGKIIGFCPSCQ